MKSFFRALRGKPKVKKKPIPRGETSVPQEPRRQPQHFFKDDDERIDPKHEQPSNPNASMVGHDGSVRRHSSRKMFSFAHRKSDSNTDASTPKKRQPQSVLKSSPESASTPNTTKTSSTSGRPSKKVTLSTPKSSSSKSPRSPTPRRGGGLTGILGRPKR